MARTAIAPTTSSHLGVALTTVAPDLVNNNSIAPSQLLYVNNNTAGSITVTIHTNVTLDGIALPNRTITVGVGVVMLIGLLSSSYYAQADGTVWLDFSATCQVAAIVNGN